MSTRHVLTVNQVFEIMLEWLKSGDWKDAFLKVRIIIHINMLI